MKPIRFAALMTTALTLLSAIGKADTTLAIATVNNADMAIMQEISKQFEEKNPHIKLNWQVFSENEIRQSLAKSYLEQVGKSLEQHLPDSPPPGEGQFDSVTIGNYDGPIWAKWGWLVPIENLPNSYDADDLLKPVREGPSSVNRLYALPFYGESSRTFYRTDLFTKAGNNKINVNGISPGVVEPPMWYEVDALFVKYENRLIGEKKRLVGEGVPYGHMGLPEDHAGAAVFLASSDTDYIVAQTLNVDGGQWIELSHGGYARHSMITEAPKS